MTDYYDILGLQPGASKEQIKAAYRRLCQECHPDKLPPETPKKARQIVEEHFKQINEAYAYLMEQGDRPPPPTQPATDVRTARSIFDPARMEAVARKLETERQTIQRQYQQSINAIDQQQRQKLACHGLRIDDLDTVDLATKWGNVIQGGILLLVGLLVGSVGGLLGFLGYLWAFFCFWGTLGAMLTKTVSPRKYKILCEIKKETEAAKAAAAQKKERRLQEQSSYIRRHIDYFKTLPLEMLSESFVQNLSDEDQFFLLLAIKEKEDDEQWARTVAAGVEIAAAAGVVLLLSQLFLGEPF
ncbi:J domain-containing protein [Thermosynechococcus sp. B0]|uniref:J domain-containing protein n=1 Tax=Thermosynechococcus sp. B0 TaxID=2937284 RepID=UPI0025762A1F|nr:J domain-containing protein [Thermosynechococcus sp. B0]WJI24183.1 J domain-containing protein [Thermosynechococcus sp. B0]